MHKDPTWCPQCKAPFTALLTYRRLDGTLSDFPVEESVCLLKRSQWFTDHLKVCACPVGHPSWQPARPATVAVLGPRCKFSVCVDALYLSQRASHADIQDTPCMPLGCMHANFQAVRQRHAIHGLHHGVGEGRCLAACVQGVGLYSSMLTQEVEKGKG